MIYWLSFILERSASSDRFCLYFAKGRRFDGLDRCIRIYTRTCYLFNWTFRKLIARGTYRNLDRKLALYIAISIFSIGLLSAISRRLVMNLTNHIIGTTHLLFGLSGCSLYIIIFIIIIPLIGTALYVLLGVVQVNFDTCVIKPWLRYC